MITITRREARRLRAVFRRSTLGIGHRGPVPPIVFRAEGTKLRAQHRYAALAVEHALDVQPGGTGAVTLPLDALADFEGKDDAPVAIEALAPDRTVARWADRGIPQSGEYAVPAPDALASFPESPGSWSEAPASLLDVLAEASLTAAEGSSRYALACILLRAGTGQVVATDGHQILVQGGHHFPFGGDVLIRRSPLFANKALPRDRPLAIGKTDTHVVLCAGPWTMFHEIQTEARFPRVEHVIPDAEVAATRLYLDRDDAAFLGEALDRLPGADLLHGPATMDINGRIAVRVRGADQERPTELILGRSRHAGPPARFVANRAFLARALRLGFAEVEVLDADSPVVLRDRERVYCFQPLSQDAALGPSEDAIRIDSARSTPGPQCRRDDAPSPRPAIRPRSSPDRDRGADPSATTPPAPVDGATVALADLIREAEAIHGVLAAARARTRGLIVALRRQRKQARAMAGALKAPRALRLQDVAR